RDGPDGRSSRTWGFSHGAGLAREAASPDAGELHRVESRTREVCDGRDGSLRRSVPAAGRGAQARVAGPHPGGHEGIRSAGRRRIARVTELAGWIEALFAAGERADRDEARKAFATLQRALGTGTVRAAEPDAGAPAGWRVNSWVKQG